MLFRTFLFGLFYFIVTTDNTYIEETCNRKRLAHSLTNVLRLAPLTLLMCSNVILDLERFSYLKSLSNLKCSFNVRPSDFFEIYFKWVHQQ